MVIRKCNSMLPVFNYWYIHHIAGYSITVLVCFHYILRLFLIFSFLLPPPQVLTHSSELFRQNNCKFIVLITRLLSLVHVQDCWFRTSDSVQHVTIERIIRSYEIHNKRRKCSLTMECLSVLLLLLTVVLHVNQKVCGFYGFLVEICS